MSFPPQTTETLLRIAIQKSGRLHEDSVALLRDCGIQVPNPSGKLKARAGNYPLELFFLRDDDIPQYVADGVADAGIVGLNVVREKNKELNTLQNLGFGKCRLSIAVKEGHHYTNLQDLQGKRVATSYVHLLAQSLQQAGVHAEIHEISGSVEIAPSIGMADAICDLVSSGSTLLMNGLKEVEVLLHSEAQLVAHQALDPERTRLLQALQFRIQAVMRSKNNKYILLNAPNDSIAAICRILPGVKSPTILPLAEAGWSSLHSVISEDQFWEIIAELKAAGAQGILVIPIEKMIL